ncbi:MAG: coproporphyrinogen III oxidase, partial [Verrucomicrobiales bacterium]
MPSSPDAVSALELASSLQARFVNKLESVANRHGQSVSFEETKWLRDEGLHGGGNRFTAPEGSIYNRASVNVSQIHYDDQPDKKLGSATAISTIIHPGNPHAPSVHIHISWTEMKNGNGYWRIMGDLNPSMVNEEYKDRFTAAMKEAAPNQFKEAAAQGDRYFYIPALKRHRGVTHFYLESYHTDNRATDHELAKQFGETVIDTYVDILDAALTSYPDFDDKARAEQ